MHLYHTQARGKKIVDLFNFRLLYIDRVSTTVFLLFLGFKKILLLQKGFYYMCVCQFFYCISNIFVTLYIFFIMKSPYRDFLLNPFANEIIPSTLPSLASKIRKVY